MLHEKRFRREDLFRMREEGSLDYLAKYVTDDALSILEGHCDAYTLFDEEENALCSIGVIPIWENRGEGWAIFSKRAGRHLVSITRMVQRYLSVAPYIRIETTVDRNFERGHRWALLLGFEKEGDKLESYTPDLRDVSLYARIKRGKN